MLNSIKHYNMMKKFTYGGIIRMKNYDVSNIQYGVEYITIKKLFGVYDVSIKFDKVINIFIGENGLGKTTILNCIYYMLTKRFDKLSEIKFESIIIKFVEESETHNVTIADIIKFNNKGRPRRNRIDNDYIQYIVFEVQDRLRHLNDVDVDYEIEKAARRISLEFDIPVSMSRREVIRYLNNDQSSFLTKEQGNAEKIERLIIAINKYIKGNIIYLPTYRRIENDFSKLLNDSNVMSNSDQLIKFGMSDVQKQINKTLGIIKNEAIDSFNKMTGILLKQYASRNSSIEKSTRNGNIDIETVKIIFNRIGEISQSDKEHIEKLLANGNINKDDYAYLKNLLLNLIEGYEIQRKYDDRVKQFVSTCNKYLNQKQMFYNQNDLSLKIVMDYSLNTDGKGIELTDLSSGEKQIVSLFSRLYLDIDAPSIIIIDEPELSLSINWQRMLLPDIFDSGNCSLLLTVTHSPFIFDNEFDYLAKDMKEIIKFPRKKVSGN